MALLLVWALLAPTAAALVLPALPHRRAAVAAAVRVQPSRHLARRCEPWLCTAAAAAPSPTDPPEAGAGAWLWGPKPLEAALPQAVVCLAGYLFHVCVLSRRSFTLAGRSLGWDTLVGLGVIGWAAWRRMRVLGRAVPPWLDGSGSSTADEASSCLDLSGAPDAEKLQLLLTSVILLVAPFGFSVLSPLFNAGLYGLVLLGLPLTPAVMPGARLLLEQSFLYFCLLRLVAARHGPRFFGRGSAWVRMRLRGPWLWPVLGGYAASLSLFNLVEPINQALLPHLAFAAEGPVAKLANPADKSPAALLIAALTPCVGAPLYEELQSRAFLLQAMTAVLPLRGALLASGLLFGAQHMQARQQQPQQQQQQQQQPQQHIYRRACVCGSQHMAAAHAHTRTRAHAHTRTRAHAHTCTRAHAHVHNTHRWGCCCLSR